jgi:16S rRNA C1402 (ribose-2'-O) methylase RsmI
LRNSFGVEEQLRGRVEDVQNMLQETKIKGEFVVVVAPKGYTEGSNMDFDR